MGDRENYGEKLPPEYFNLIRNILKEKKDEPERPLKRKRSKQEPKKQATDVSRVVSSSSDPKTIEIDSSNELFEESEERDDSNEHSDVNNNDDNDYESDDFEDVGEPIGPPEPTGDISVSIEAWDSKRKVAKKVRNVVSNDERLWRRYLHMACIIALVAHGYVRNNWINNRKLQKKLCKLIPDKVLQTLHPQKDEELPLRSTRKLLDGLKMCMEIWNKHWKVMKDYEGTGCYMKSWNELRDPNIQRVTFTEKQFVRQVLKGIGDRDIAAQGFVALLRSCNVNARLIMSLQPPDFCDLKIADNRNDSATLPSSLFKYPIFWCEVWDKFCKKWITIDAINLKVIEQIRSQSKLEPQGTASRQRNLLRYVIGFDRRNGVRDVTRRYSHWFNCKCIRRRITKDSHYVDWYARLLRKLHRRKRTRIDDYEDEYFQQRDENEGIPDNTQDLKNHPRYVLEKDLRQNQIIKPGCKECGYLNARNNKDLWKVYDRKDIMDLKSARQWYFEGRILKVGSRSMRKVPRRTRSGKVETEEEENLYSWEDTELYVPPLASEPDGKIVKNTFENIEVFVPSMIPRNCVLISSDLAIKAARILKIEYARAVTSFKFEKGRPTRPVIGGIVVGQWFKHGVLCAIEGLQDAIEQENFEAKELKNLSEWNLLLTKLHLKSELNRTYGKVEDPVDSSNRNELLDMGKSLSDDDGNDDGDYGGTAGGFIVRDNAEISQPPQKYEIKDDDNYKEPDHDVDLQDDQEHNNESYEDFMGELDMSNSE